MPFLKQLVLNWIFTSQASFEVHRTPTLPRRTVSTCRKSAPKPGLWLQRTLRPRLPVLGVQKECFRETQDPTFLGEVQLLLVLQQARKENHSDSGSAQSLRSSMSVRKPRPQKHQPVSEPRHGFPSATWETAEQTTGHGRQKCF